MRLFELGQLWHVGQEMQNVCIMVDCCQHWDKVGFCTYPYGLLVGNCTSAVLFG